MLVRSVFKFAFAVVLTTGLLLSSGFFSILLYMNMSGKTIHLFTRSIPEVQRENAPIVHKAALTAHQPAAAPEAAKSSVMIQAPILKQFPELANGCEITSLAMLLQFYGVAVSKTDLAAKMKIDPTPIKLDSSGNIIYWGNPNEGFVGDVTGTKQGFGIYHGPLFKLLHSYVPTADDMTGDSFGQIESRLSEGIPVMAWTTINFKVPDQWVSWNTPEGRFRSTFLEHAVLIVGYDRKNVYVNNPWTGQKQEAVSKSMFLASWKAMGSQALSYQKYK